MSKKLEEVFIDSAGEQIPVKLFLIQMKKNYIYCINEYDKILFKLSVGKLRKKTVETLMDEASKLQGEMIEIGGVYWSAVEYAKNQGVYDELMEDKFLNDSWQLTDDQKEELNKDQEEYEKTQSKYEKYMEYFSTLAVPSQAAKTKIEKIVE